MSPFKALYGRDPFFLLRLVEEDSPVEGVNSHISEHNLIIDELKLNLTRAQDKMKKYADKHRREVQFEVGTQVYLKLQPYRFRSLAARPNEKLRPHFYGPYEVIERIGPVASHLALPSTARIHSVFHVSQLKKVIGPSITSQPLPSCLAEDLELQLQPEALRDVSHLPSGQLEVLIKWRDLPECECIHTLGEFQYNS